jgi:adenine-specific DNA-methyltransferase
MYSLSLGGKVFKCGKKSWRTHPDGMNRLIKAHRIIAPGKLPCYKTFHNDFSVQPLHNIWDDTHGASDLVYVVQTSNKVVQRCILMTTDPGDVVLDPTCGSGTTAYVAEQWGRRWITVDTSRVALALVRARIMGARYSYYLLADSPAGKKKEAEITRTASSFSTTNGNIRQGFVCKRVPHITLKSIANNVEIDVIWDSFQEILEPLRKKLNTELNQSWEEWGIPREAGYPWDSSTQAIFHKLKVEQGKNKEARKKILNEQLSAINHNLDRSYTLDTLPNKPVDPWPKLATELHTQWWQQRIARQKEIDASIAAKADFEYLYDKPYADTSKVRVAGPFTVESISPHRVLVVDQDDELVVPDKVSTDKTNGETDFATMILENLKIAGVQQAHKENKRDRSETGVSALQFI